MIAAAIAQEIGAAVIDGDDFYAGGSEADWDARTAEEKVALVIDWRRMRSEAIEPLLGGRVASWHPFDWDAGHGLAATPIVAESAPVVILDGAYSARPELSDLIDLFVLIEAPDDVRRERLIGREGADYTDDWYTRWDEAETYYFAEVRPPSSFDLIVRNDMRSSASSAAGA